MARYRMKRKHRREVNAMVFKGRPDMEPDAAGFYPVGVGRFAKPGDYLVQRDGAAMRVMTPEEFGEQYEPIDAPAEPNDAVVDAVSDEPVDDIPVDPPKPKKKRSVKARKAAPSNKSTTRRTSKK